MELPILLLKDALLQQQEQLSRAEKDLNKDPKFTEFRQKVIDNLKRFIAELEEGINILTKADEQKETLIINGVGNTEGEFCGICEESFRIVTGKICEHKECVRYR